MLFKNLQTNFLERNCIYYNKIDSTQAEIYRLIEKGTIVNGTLVMADIQTKGVGTHGRTWYTDEGNNIAFSFYIKLNCNIKTLNGLTYEIANTIVQIFKEKYNINLQIKEPNDIIFKDKKLGGILTETKVVLENVKYIVIGIGINTNKQNFTDDIKNIATSIKKEFNIQVNTEDFVVEFCNKFEKQIIKRIVN